MNEKRDILLVSLLIDDLIFLETNPLMFEEYKMTMACEFEKTNIGLMPYFPRIEVK